MFAYVFRNWKGDIDVYQHHGINEKGEARNRKDAYGAQWLFLIYVAM